jgi:hypothetical protein
LEPLGEVVGLGWWIRYGRKGLRVPDFCGLRLLNIVARLARIAHASLGFREGNERKRQGRRNLGLVGVTIDFGMRLLKRFEFRVEHQIAPLVFKVRGLRVGSYDAIEEVEVARDFAARLANLWLGLGRR